MSRLLWIAVGVAAGAAAALACRTRPAPPDMVIDPEDEPVPAEDEPGGNPGFFAPTQ